MGQVKSASLRTIQLGQPLCGVNNEEAAEQRGALTIVRAACQVAIDHLEPAVPEQLELLDQLEAVCERLDTLIGRLAS
jgi:hypothetical protein